MFLHINYECLSPLCKAVYDNDVTAIEASLRSGDNVNRLESNMTPLILASYLGNQDALNALLRANADLYKTDVCGRTALHYAKNGGIVKALMSVLQSEEAQSDYLYKTDVCGYTALHSAAGNGDTVDALMSVLPSEEAKIKYAKQLTTSGCSALHFVMEPIALRALLKVFPDEEAVVSYINHADNCGWTPFFYIASSYYDDATVGAALVSSLIELGVNVNVRDADKCTPLMEVKHPEIATVLLDAGADTSMVDSKGRTTIWYLRGKELYSVISMIEERAAAADAHEEAHEAAAAAAAHAPAAAAPQPHEEAATAVHEAAEAAVDILGTHDVSEA